MDVSFGGRSHSFLQDKGPGVELLGHREHGHLPLIFSNSLSVWLDYFTRHQQWVRVPPGGDILVHINISVPWSWPHPLSPGHSPQPPAGLLPFYFPPCSLRDSFDILTISLSDLDPSELWHLLNFYAEGLRPGKEPAILLG